MLCKFELFVLGLNIKLSIQAFAPNQSLCSLIDSAVMSTTIHPISETPEIG